MNCEAKIQCKNIASHPLGLLAVCFALLLAACAPAPEPKTDPAPAVDLYKLEADAGQALGLALANSKRLDTLQQRLDSLTERLARTDSTLAALPLARTEETINQLTLLREDVQFLRDYLEGQQKVPLINPVKKLPASTLSPAPTEYTQGLAAYDQKRDTDATALFEKVPALYPNSNWSDDAWYWAGESSLRSGDFSRALAAFQKVLTYANSDKHDDAQYAIGQCYMRLGDRDRAVAELRKVEVLYPESDRIPQAQAELTKLQSR
jgi:TolA-binding protein